MIFDPLGLPRDNGSTDRQDSARLAGLVVLFDYPIKDPIDLTYYITFENNIFKYIRHPLERKYDFSRDQAVPLVAGLWKKGFHHLVNDKYITGKDILSPSVKGHFARCQGKKATWFQDLCLKIDILYHSYLTPLKEPNQLIAMLMVAGPKYVRLWKKHNQSWRYSILNYWCEGSGAWRGEQDLAFYMIKTLEVI